MADTPVMRATRRVSDSEKLARLEVLSAAPEEQRAYALSLVEGERTLDVLVPALEVLVAAADPRARVAVLDRYDCWRDWMQGHLRVGVACGILSLYGNLPYCYTTEVR